jgi:DNA-binding FadR family transcriptional regulator
MPRQGGLHAQVVDDLGSAIVSGRVPVGVLIDPVEVESRLGVSRSVVREALRVLSSLGLITARHKVGTRVQPRSEWNLLHPQLIQWRADSADGDRQLHDLLQLRLGVEPLAARLCVGRLTADELDELDRACEGLAAAARANDRAAFLRADEAFHGLLLARCGNELVAQLQLVVVGALRARQHVSRAVTTEQTPAALALHRRIVRALRAATVDAEAAARQAERAARQLVELADVELGFGDPTP